MENAGNNVGPPSECSYSRAPGMLVTTLVVTIFASVVTFLRLGVRIWVVRKVGLDDYTIVAATLGIIIGCGLVIVQIHYGFGKHKACLSEWHYIEFQKYSYGEWIQTFQTLMFNKLSICFFLLRIPVETRYIRPIQGTVIGLIVSNIALTLVWIFQCNPIAGAWNTNVPAKCFTYAQLQRIIISQAIISIISDFMLALFPIVLLWKVQISLRIKAGLCFLMALGLITAAFCIVRTVLNYQNVNQDGTWESVPNWYFRSWEVCIGIVAASIPALRPGYRVLSSTLHSYASARGSSRRTGSGDSGQKALAVEKPNAGGKNVDELEDKIHLAQELVQPGVKPDEDGMREARHRAKVETEKRRVVREGDDGFAMEGLRGDLGAGEGQILKTTWFDVEGGRSGSESSAERDLERGQRNFI
ncbi:MAG: hypothetical protein M1821_002325 [Bathelium mastoideum]|nr:MAG: hypothetical protein M1821_002325 [Bathelium mastoideum]